jgi:hypothetical protein
LEQKLYIEPGLGRIDKIDKILQHVDRPMNNLWVYIMSSGYAVIFVDDASPGNADLSNIYGTSLAYDETCEKLIYIRELCDEIGFCL